MAERRMFTQKIVDSDAFLDMPLSTQALYFHLNMRADDDGFVNNPKKIQRMIGASEDDLRILISKRFLLTFESGVIVIKHWRMHNLIRNDRHNPTQYQDELSKIRLKDNGAYTENDNLIVQNADEYLVSSNGCQFDNQMTTTCQPSDNQMSAQDRLGKDSIGKGSIGEDRGVTTKVDCQLIADMYNRICISFPELQSLSDARRKAIKARLNQYSVDDFEKVFRKAESSAFLKGRNARNWSATFDWLIKDANFAKVLDGNYDDRETATSTEAPKSKAAQELDDFYAMVNEWAQNGGESDDAK